MEKYYKWLVCTLFALQAALYISALPATACGHRIKADAQGCCYAKGTVLAEDGSSEESEADRKTRLKKQAKNSWQIYACIGGGAVVVISIICLLADNKKR